MDTRTDQTSSSETNLTVGGRTVSAARLGPLSPRRMQHLDTLQLYQRCSEFRETLWTDSEVTRSMLSDRSAQAKTYCPQCCQQYGTRILRSACYCRTTPESGMGETSPDIVPGSGSTTTGRNSSEQPQVQCLLPKTYSACTRYAGLCADMDFTELERRVCAAASAPGSQMQEYLHSGMQAMSYGSTTATKQAMPGPSQR